MVTRKAKLKAKVLSQIPISLKKPIRSTANQKNRKAIILPNVFLKDQFSLLGRELAIVITLCLEKKFFLKSLV